MSPGKWQEICVTIPRRRRVKKSDTAAGAHTPIAGGSDWFKSHQAAEAAPFVQGASDRLAGFP